MKEILTTMLWIVLCITLFWAGYVIGHQDGYNDGAIAVTNGTVECKLIPNKDMSMDWDCRKLSK
jgi:hypothetical protein